LCEAHNDNNSSFVMVFFGFFEGFVGT